MAARSHGPADSSEDADDADLDAAEARRRALSTSDCGTPNCLVVGLDCRSMNLYRFLRVRFPRVAHGTLRGWIDDEKVKLNGTAVSDSRPLRFGDVVEIDADVEAEARARRPSRADLIFEDAAILAANKPAGLATAPERRARQPHLLGMLKEAGADTADQTVKLVHRIDKPASGVVVFARGRANKQALQAEFAERRVIKDYLALVSGHFPDGPVVIDARLKPRLGKVHRMVVVTAGGKESVTLARRVWRFRGYSVVHARPVTGRTHQIRAHLRHLGHAIVGDTVYGGEEQILLSALKYGYRRARGEDERPLLARLALHACHVELTSPASGQRVHLHAPLPKDLRSVLKQLQKSAAVRADATFATTFLDDPVGARSAGDPFAGASS